MAYVGATPAKIPLTSSDIEDGIITADKLATDAVETAKVKDVNVTAGKLATTQDLSSKTITLPATVAGLGTGINVTNQITGVVPAANLGSGTASSSTYLAGDSTYKTISEYNDNKLQSNIALLGFKTAVNGSLAKYNLQDQIIDEYEDATGIDAGASTNERLVSGVYDGGATVTPTVTGGTATTDGLYTVRSITATGSTDFITDTAMTVDYLIVGGGGAGGYGNGGGGGGGAGGYISATSQSLAIGTYAAVIGTGGTGGPYTYPGAAGTAGTDSTWNSQTAGGGAGGPANDTAGVAGDTANGGSGSGSSGSTSAGGAAGSQGTTNAGGLGGSNDGGGGGGAGAAGGAGITQTSGGDGGVGLSNSITGSAVFYAGGGGGNSESGTGGDGGNGGGGDGQEQATTAATNGTDGTGGGGGGADDSNPLSAKAGDGGDGIVIVRYITEIVTAGADLTLQSTDTTAMAEPDYADMVMLMENAEGTATINTDIKGYISKDSGSTFTEGTLVDEGTWGTNKKILAFHDLDISAQSGTSMCYKITTHNQSAGSKETKIHATSIGWKA